MSLRWKAGLAGILVLSAVTYATAQMTPDHAAMMGLALQGSLCRRGRTPSGLSKRS